MSIHVRQSVCFSIAALALCAGGCSQSSPPSNTSTAAAGAAPLASAAAAPIDANSPCRLLTDSEVRAVFPDAKSGVPERTREEYGIRACVWDTPAGQFAVQVWASKGGSVDNEIRGLAGAE